MNKQIHTQGSIVGWLIAVLVTTLPVHAADSEAEWPTLSYNGLATVLLASPAEICQEEGEDEHCFLFQALDGGELAGLQFPIEQVSMPKSAYGGLVAGRHGGDFGWFIYDLELRDYILSPAEKQEVLQEWQQRGLEPPGFLDALDAKPLFVSSGNSTAVIINVLMAAVGLIAAAALALFILFGLVRWLFRKRFTQSRLEKITGGLWILALVCALAWIAVLLLVLWSDV